MASKPDAGTAEAIAYALMQDVMVAERHALAAAPMEGWRTADRAYLLDLYAECRKAVDGRREPSDADGPGAVPVPAGAGAGWMA